MVNWSSVNSGICPEFYYTNVSTRGKESGNNFNFKSKRNWYFATDQTAIFYVWNTEKVIWNFFQY